MVMASTSNTSKSKAPVRHRRYSSWIACVFAGAMLASMTGCLGILDTMGREEEVTEREDLFKEPTVEDDEIEDKNPTYDPDLFFEEEFGDCIFRMNKSGAVTKLDVVELEDENSDLEHELFPDRGSALEDLSSRAGVDVLPSLEVINGSLKGFNDGLYASVEVGVQEGVTGVFESKRQFLMDLALRLDEAHDLATGAAKDHLGAGLAHVAAGLLVSGETIGDLPEMDPSVVAAAENMVAQFESEPIFSAPMGFYNWTDTLLQVYRQDRFFQNRLSVMGEDGVLSSDEVGRFAAMAAVIEDATDLRPRYESIIALYAGLTNPYDSYSVAALFDYVDGVASLEDVSSIRNSFLADNPAPFVCRGTYVALFPASRSKDSEFFSELFCHEPPPSDVTFIDILINGIREGIVDLSPDESSGWYDYQLYALETLLVPNQGPESDHLLLTKAYKEKLIETFKTIITQTRETHVKQASTPGGGISAPPKEADIYPKFPVEPFPTFYLRTARGYRFLRTYLEGVLGGDFLTARGRMLVDGSMSEKSLAEELADIIKRTYGLYVLSARAVGLEPSEHLLADETAEFPVEECVAAASSWLSSWESDHDVLADPRVIVPAGMDNQSQEAIYWATIGVRAIKISAEFVEGYEPEVEPSPETHCELREILSHDYFLLVEVMREVRIGLDRTPPTREELRDICDSNETADEIVDALQNL